MASLNISGVWPLVCVRTDNVSLFLHSEQKEPCSIIVGEVVVTGGIIQDFVGSDEKDWNLWELDQTSPIISGGAINNQKETKQIQMNNRSSTRWQSRLLAH